MSRVAICLLLLAACAHGPPTTSAEPDREQRAWPPPPARPMVRFLESFPRVDRAPPRAPFWRRLLGVIVGTEPESRGPAFLLERPFGVAAIHGGFVVADPDGRQVLKVASREDQVTPLECPDHPWKMPLAVAAEHDGTVYVADGAAGLVLRIAADGTCLAIGKGALERPSGLAFVAGRIYVVDPPRHQIVAFTPDGREVLRFGGRGEKSGEYNFPSGLGAGPDQTLLIIDALNFRVVQCNKDGEVQGGFGQAGDGSGAFGRPKGVATDAAGQIYVSDAQNDVVIVFSRLGRFLIAVGGSGAAPGSLTLPAGIAIGDGFLYVADSYNHRVQVFQLLDGEPP